MPHTLLATDLVDSTRHVAALGDVRAAALFRHHDRAARDLFQACGARELERTDGLVLQFDATVDAARVASAYHAVVAEIGEQAGVSLSARVAVHVEDTPGAGRAELARLVALAPPGRTLVSEAAVASLGPAFPRARRMPDGRLRSAPGPAGVLVPAGTWQMRGAAAPVPLWELFATTPDPYAPPPDRGGTWQVVQSGGVWRPVAPIPHALPSERDAFFGRASVLADLGERLDAGGRVVTLIGMGGSGKTRLVLHLAWQWLGSWPGGAWFCDLSPARDLEGVTSAVARALDVPLVGTGDAVARLADALRGRGRCLVILDNVEQVVRHAADAIGLWLDAAPELTVVATSREVLGIAGEQVLAVPPLLIADAVALFEARARGAGSTWALTPAQQPTIERLVSLLDCIPLAVELAAARVRVLTPAQILARMSDRFRLLTASGGRHDRHATLQATLDWSWQLLSDAERMALAQLAVFEGGFTLEAAEAVVDLSLAVDAPWTVDLVQALVDKSLVRVVEDGRRFGMYVSVQEYGLARLGEPGAFTGSGPQAEDAALQRHVALFAGFGTREAIDALSTHGGEVRRQQLAVELDNLVSAVRRALQLAEGAAAVQALAAVWSTVLAMGPYALALGLCDEVLASPCLSRVERARVSFMLQAIRVSAGEAAAAHAALKQLLPEAEALGDARLHVEVVRSTASSALRAGDLAEAVTLGEQSLALARAAGLRLEEARILGNLAYALEETGRPEARAAVEASLALFRSLGSLRDEGIVLVHLGALDRQEGRHVAARGHYEAALAIHRAWGHRSNEGVALINLAVLDFSEGRLADAEKRANQAVLLQRQTGNRRSEAIALSNLGRVVARLGRFEEAEAILVSAEAIVQALGLKRQRLYIALNRIEARAWRGDLAAAWAAYAEIEALTADDAVAAVHLACARVQLGLAAGQREAARAALVEAEALASESPEKSSFFEELAQARKDVAQLAEG